MQKREKTNRYSVVIGIDWADQKNDLWIIESETGKGTHRQVAQDAVSLHEFAVEISMPAWASAWPWWWTRSEEG